jgi:hypothetical protein
MLGYCRKLRGKARRQAAEESLRDRERQPRFVTDNTRSPWPAATRSPATSLSTGTTRNGMA